MGSVSTSLGNFGRAWSIIVTTPAGAFNLSNGVNALSIPTLRPI